MKRQPTPHAGARARWFAELSAALGDGERVLTQLAAEGANPADTEPLRLRLATLRAELGRLDRVGLEENRVVGMSWPDAQSG